MSLNDSVSVAAAHRLSALTLEDIAVVIRSASLGLAPSQLHAGVAAIARGEDFPLPGTLGKPRPLKINAWSFISDHGQYHDTYGLSDAKAGELKGLFRGDPDGAIAEITALVTSQLRVKGSNRPVIVTKAGSPGAAPTDHAPAPGAQGGADLKAEIVRNPSLYGMYKFEAIDTGRPGPYRYSVRLGSGLFAVFPSKQGAINVARICRVLGRDAQVIAGRIAFMRPGKTPQVGNDIPAKVTFDGRLRPGEESPPDPVSTDHSVAGAP